VASEHFFLINRIPELEVSNRKQSLSAITTNKKALLVVQGSLKRYNPTDTIQEHAEPPIRTQETNIQAVIIAKA
jgi:hypothetical protein